MLEEGFVQVEGGRVWYTRQGAASTIPLIIMHGGPGSASISMEPLLALADEREVILYDQLGCGKSDRPTNKALWRIERFVEELATLRSTLGLEQVHLLGHSWGTMLLADYLLTKPEGVVSATFSSPCLSSKRWLEDAMTYRKALPEDVQETLNECERLGTTDSEAYEKATEVYTRRHVRRVELPADMATQRKQAFGKDVYNTMWGPSEFYATGNLKDYDCTRSLPDFRVPSLFTCGFYDEASPTSTAYYQSLVPNSRLHVFRHSSHMPQIEEPKAYLDVLRSFLRDVESSLN